MRAILLIAGTTIVAGCLDIPSSQTVDSCEEASHALRIHDSRIEAAKAGGSAGFTATLASRGYAKYHCRTVQGDQIACSPIERGLAQQNSATLNRLLRERNAKEARAARACQI